MLGTEYEEVDKSLVGKFLDAGKDLKDNLMALFRDRPADWDGLDRFYDEVFFPYLVGGVIPGVITATICYLISLPVIRAYQQHRRSRIKAKYEAIKKRAEMEAAGITPVVEPAKPKPKLSLSRVRKAK